MAEAIINIPHDTTLAYHEVNSTAYRYIVPSNAENRALINKIGGKSYKTRNLIPFPYFANEPSARNGITYTIQDNGTVVLNGVSTERSYRTIAGELTLTAGKVYTLSGCPSGGSTTGATNPTYALYISEVKNGAWSREFQEAGNGVRFTAQENCVYTVSVNVWSADVTCENLVFKPMLNEGDTALPYEPYFEGIRDTKVMALKSEGANLAHSISEGSNTTITDGVVTQVEADTYEEIIFKCQLYSETGYQSGGVVKWLYATGVHSATFNKEGAETRCVFGINGKIINTVIAIDITDLPIGEYTVSANFTNITQGSISWKDIMLNVGSVAIPYKPYVGTLDTLAIPEAVQSIEGYGLGVNENYFNYIDFKRKVFKAPCRRFLIDGSIGTYTTSPFANAWYIVVSTLGYSDRIITGLADKYNRLTYHELHAGGKDGIYLSNSYEIFIIDSRFTDAATAKSILSESPVECVCAFDTEIETDISEYLTDEFIKVEGGGTVTAVNEHEEGVPTSVTYLIETVGG